MYVLRSLALTYDANQDRILAVVNPGRLDSWSFWLTRRLALEVLDRVPAVLEGTSALVKQAPAEYRSDLAAFEREAALVNTAGAMTRTDLSVMKINTDVAELAITLAMSDLGDGFRFELHGERGGRAAGVFRRAELQRVLQLVYREAIKASWIAAPVMSPESTSAETDAVRPIRH